MKNIVLFFVLVHCLAVMGQNDPSTQQKALRTIQNLMGPGALNVAASEISVNCGGVLAAATGVVSYKFGEQLTGDSCVWVIQPLRRHRVNFRLIYAGFGANSSINIYSPTVMTGEIRQVATLTRAAPSVQNMVGSIFYVHFRAQGNTNETGFILSYDGQTPDSTTVPRHTQRLLTGDSGTHRYPQTGENYTQNAFSSFVLSPTSGRSVSLTVRNVSIPIVRGNNAICTGDILNVYQFDGLQPYSQIRFCSKSENSRVTLNSFSPVLVTLNSVNRALPGRDGFELDWNYETDPGTTTTTEEVPQTTSLEEA